MSDIIDEEKMEMYLRLSGWRHVVISNTAYRWNHPVGGWFIETKNAYNWHMRQNENNNKRK